MRSRFAGTSKKPPQLIEPVAVLVQTSLMLYGHARTQVRNKKGHPTGTALKNNLEI
jgi:hypothetical protein